jgi:hypothetical protein
MPSNRRPQFRSLIAAASGISVFLWQLCSLVPMAHALSLTTIDQSDPNKFVASLAARSLEYLTIVAAPLAIGGIFFMAYKLVTSAGNPEAFNSAKKNILSIITGIFLVVFAVIIVKLVASFFPLILSNSSS